jgi:hypothetical protein
VNYPDTGFSRPDGLSDAENTSKFLPYARARTVEQASPSRAKSYIISTVCQVQDGLALSDKSNIL